LVFDVGPSEPPSPGEIAFDEADRKARYAIVGHAFGDETLERLKSVGR
jgi:hypothetical protein